MPAPTRCSRVQSRFASPRSCISASPTSRKSAWPVTPSRWLPISARRVSNSIDGVSCEVCHGPASGWLGPHTTKDWPHEKSVQLGMYDTRDLIKRSERCLNCHLGTAEKFVDHEMIAAGHPDLTFELNLFSSVMPRHWKEPSDNGWRGVQVWGVGEAVQLQKALERLARRASSSNWPEYAELDCFACHHSLTKPEDSWRQEMGYAGRQPGVPAWNESRYVVFRHIAKRISPEGSAAGCRHHEARRLARRAQRKSTRNCSTATRRGGAGFAVCAKIERENVRPGVRPRRHEVDRAGWRFHLCAGTASCRAGRHVARLAVRGVQAKHKDANDAELRDAINGLFQQVDNPSAYNAPRFAAQMQKVSVALSRAGRAEKANQ